MATVLVVLMILVVLGFVGYPLLQGIRELEGPPLPDLETQEAYADAEDLELDFRTGKVDAEEYEILRRSVALEAGDEIEQRVKALREQRKQKRAPKPAAAAPARCSQCGASLDPDDLFCSRCGTAAGHENVCRHCGTPYDEGDRFCVKCGKPL